MQSVLSKPRIAKPIPVNRIALERDLTKTSFYDFFKRFWSVCVHEPLVENWHIKLLCDELQAVAQRTIGKPNPDLSINQRIRFPKEHDLIINVSPGSTKSTLASVMFPAWCWANDPTFRIICGSYAASLSLDLAYKCNSLVTSDKYLELFPDVVLAKTALSLMKTTMDGERACTSTGGAITGKHAHIILVDDPLNPKQAASEAELRSANKWFDQTLPSRMVDKSLTPVVLVMQRLHQDDPTAHRLAQTGAGPVRHICLPAEISDDVRPRGLRKRYVNGLFDSIRLPKKVLDEIHATDQYAYAGQYLQVPVPPGEGMFLVDKIQLMPSSVSMKRVVRFWDKAGSHKTGCFTVGAKIGVAMDNTFWILDIVRGQWEANERERIIRQTAEMDGKLVMIGIEQEPGSGGKESAQASVRNLAGFRVRLDRPTGDKVFRADPFSAQVNAGNVRMVRGIWNGECLKELQYFPMGKYKDQVDSLSAGWAMLVKQKMMIGGFGVAPNQVVPTPRHNQNPGAQMRNIG